jgi:hypothetical protein
VVIPLESNIFCDIPGKKTKKVTICPGFGEEWKCIKVLTGKKKSASHLEIG